MAKRKSKARQPQTSETGTETHPEPFLLVEVRAGLDLEIGRSLARATDQACILESIGAQAFEAIGDVQRRAPARELFHRSHRLRGVIHHALSILSELQFEAGRLDALAAIRETASPTFFEPEE